MVSFFIEASPGSVANDDSSIKFGSYDMVALKNQSNLVFFDTRSASVWTVSANSFVFSND
jgi:hypothetical protein